MRKLKLFFATLALLVTGVVATNAQTNITTTAMVDADLSSLVGWGDPGRTNWVTDGAVKVVEFWNWSTQFEFKQSVSLPAGSYRLKVNSFYRESWGGDGTNNNMAWIFAGETKQNVIALGSMSELSGYAGSTDLYRAATAFSQGKYSNEFDFDLTEESSIDIGFKGTCPNGGWCILGPVQLWKYTMDDYLNDYRAKVATANGLKDQPMKSDVKSALTSAIVDEATLTTSEAIRNAEKALGQAITAAEASVAKYAEAKSYIDSRKAAVATLDDRGKAAFDNSALTALESAYNEGTLTEVTAEQKNAISNAVVAAAKAQRTDGADMSLAIVNPGFEAGDMSGWTIDGGGGDTGVKSNTTDPYTTSGGDGKFLYNTWQGDNVGHGISQKITGLPAGTYKLTACIAGMVGGQIELFAGEESTSFTQTNAGAFTDVEVNFEVGAAGEVTIGTKNSTSWYKTDNFRLTLVELKTQKIIAAVNLPEGVEMADKYFPSFNENVTIKEGQLVAAPGSEIKFTLVEEEGLIPSPEATLAGDATTQVDLTKGTGTNQWSFTMPDAAVRVTGVYLAAQRYALNGLPADNTTVTVGGVAEEGPSIQALPSKKVVVTPDPRYEITEFTATYTDATSGDPVQLTISENETDGSKSFTVPEADVTVTCTATLVVEELTDDMIDLDEIDFEYTGSAWEPEFTVFDEKFNYELKEGDDFTVEYSDNVEAGTATITITATGPLYTGTATANFYIGRKDLEDDDITIAYIFQEDYDGQKHTPRIEVRDGVKLLLEGRDYKVTFKDNVEAGSARVTFEGLGDYKGKVKKYFNIKSYVLDADMIQDIADQTWTGTAVTPAITVINGNITLVEGKDFTVKFKNNVSEGTATAIINGTGNFRSVDLVKTFKIVKKAEVVVDPGTMENPGDATAIGAVSGKTANRGTAYTLGGRKVKGNGKGVVVIDGKLVLKK